MRLRKYLHAYALSLQNTLQRRASLAMDSLGSAAVFVALYFFWESIFRERGSVAGYLREEMLTYVLLVNLLRAAVFTGRGWETVSDIAYGRISSYLLRPVSYRGYCLSVDLAQKSVHLSLAVLEIAALIALCGAPWRTPQHPATWLLFGASLLVSSVLFFLLEFCVATLAFWTSESGGPLFCFELFVQFASGAFFPVDVLPGRLRTALLATPFPHIVFHPIQIYLGKISPAQALRTLAFQAAWLAAAALAAEVLWRRGVRDYAAEGG